MRSLIVVQARTNSNRLNKKVLLPLAGAPLLQRLLQRIEAAETGADIIVATTTDPSDNIIRTMCRGLKTRCYSGEVHDLLDRHYQAAKRMKAEVVVKIPSDCPLIDPAIIRRVFDHFKQRRGEVDYVSNLHPATYPDGNDVEIMTMDALERAWKEAKEDYEREHTTPYLWDHPELFRCENVMWETQKNYSMTHRFTVDYPEDYILVKIIYKHLWREGKPMFGVEEILRFLDEHPQIRALNTDYLGVNWYRKHLEQLKHVSLGETRNAPGERSVA